MKTGWWRKMGWGAAFAALTLFVGVPGASAQVDSQDCRCIDGDGNAIDNCACFVVPEVPDIAGLMALGRGPDFDFDFDFEAPRPRLGVTVSSDQGGAMDAQGALVTDVMDGGPAGEAGIQAGDIITSVGGQSLFSPVSRDAEEDFDLDASLPVQRLLVIARELDPGQAVEVVYLRDGETRTATVEAQDLAGMWGEWGRNFRAEIMPQMEQLRERLREQSFDLERSRPDLRVLQGRGPFVQTPGAAQYGLEMVELTPGLGSYFGTDEGVLVSDVAEDSALGLLPGDVILRVGDRQPTSPEQVRRILNSYDGDEEVTFRVRRQGSEIDVLGRLGD